MLGSVSREADITELRQVVDDLMQVIDTAHAPIFGTDNNGHVTAWYQTTAETSGWTESETLGKLFVECFISEKHQPSVSEVLAGALSGRKTMSFGFPLFTKDGRRREMLTNVAARKGPDGSPIGVIAVGQDITELRNCAAEQQHNAEDLARLIETANAPIFGVSADGFVTEWNKKAAELSGYAKDETMGRLSVERFITEGYKNKVQAVLIEAVEEQKKASRGQKELQQKYAMLQIEFGYVQERDDAQCKETARDTASPHEAVNRRFTCDGFATSACPLAG